MSVPAADRSSSVDALLANLIDECTNRLQAGEQVDVEEYVRRHPEHAERIRALLPALEVLAGLGLSGGSAGAPRNVDSGPGCLGDFRLVREVGRGGMGVVYEAEQLSLKRRVALKVLPFAATMDPRHLQRFKNEALAAASLEHPHIVPVYAVGCERGVHFYAMKFIDGQSLADVLAAQQPGAAVARGETATRAAATTEGAPRNGDHFRRAARWGIEAAEALDHAHSVGVVHRDVKPANLLIDGQGKLWVADFGLARLGADPGLTMTGDVLGTLRYMAPEQALAKHGLVDHRTDVYGLGVTLYELLTGVPAFAGEDRQDLLRRIGDEEPQPPRQLNLAVPHDLETIVLKGMAKVPAERYATAQELADDLRRFLEHQPIRARRAGTLVRLHRWTQRHLGIVSAAGVGLLLALVVLAASLVTVTQAWEEAEGQRRLAEQRSADLRRRLYAAEMGAAHRHWERGEADELSSVLAGSRADGPDENLLGFEWHYLRGLARSRPRELLTYRGHAEDVYMAAFSPDGTTVASASRDHTFQLWDAATGKLRMALGDLPGEGNCVAFTPDGRTLAAGCQDGSLRFWDLVSRQVYLIPAAHKGELHFLSFAPNGRTLFTSGNDGYVRVWDAASRVQEREFQAHTHRATMVIPSPDGRSLATAGHDGLAKVWDLGSLTERYRLQAVEGRMLDVCFSPDGSLLATSEDNGTIKLWDAATGRPLRALGKHFGAAWGLCFSPKGGLLASGAYDGRVRIWSIPDGILWCHFKAHPGPVWLGSFSPDGTKLITPSSDDAVKVWDLTPLSRHGHSVAIGSGGVNRVTFVGGGNDLAVLTSDGQIAIGTGDDDPIFKSLPVRTLGSPFAPGDLAFSPDGETLALSEPDGSLRLWHRGQKRERLVLRADPETTGPDGRVWPPVVNGFTISPDGRFLVAIQNGGLMKGWALPGGEARFRERLPWPHARRLAVSPDGHTLAVVNFTDTFRFWDLDSGRWIGEALPCPEGADSIGFSPDGAGLAVGCSDGSLKIVEVPSGKEKVRLIGHMGGLTAVAFSPDGRTLASASGDRTLRLWHIATGQELFALPTGGSLVRSVAFSPDGKVLVAGGGRDAAGRNLWLWYANGQGHP